MLLQEKLSEMEEAARQKMEELKLRGEEYKDESGDRGGHESSEHTGEYIRYIYKTHNEINFLYQLFISILIECYMIV